MKANRFVLVIIFATLTTGCQPVIFDKGISINNSISSVSSDDQTGTINNIPVSSPTGFDLYNDIFQRKKEVENVGIVKGAIVPHHDLAGYIPATLFNYLSKQKPSLIVLIGPNHFNVGNSAIISTLQNYQTPFGVTINDSSLVEKIVKKGIAKVNEQVMVREHSINFLVPFIGKTLSNTKVASFIVGWKTPTATMDKLVGELIDALPADAVIVASVDFSHYQTWPVANLHDETSVNVIQNFDYSRLYNLEIDSHPSVYALLKLMDFYQSKKIGYSLRDNSAQLLGRPNLKETTSYYSPWFVAGEKTTVKPSISLLFFGDMMLDRSVKIAIGKNGADWIFEKLAGEENRFFMGFDAVHANLEGPFANSRRTTGKSIAFRFDPKLIATLKKYNFNIFSLANNHSLDMSSAGFRESKNNLSQANIDFYGDGYGVSASSTIIKQINGMKVAFLGFNDTFYRLDNKMLSSYVRKAKKIADLVIVNIHWGDEYKVLSNTRQRVLAHELIDAGADIIIGHHPHVVQEMEVYKNHPIFYSLGNFIFDQYFSKETQQGLAVGIVASTSSLSVSVFPLQSSVSQVSQMPYIDGLRYLKGWEKKSRINSNSFVNFNIKL